MQDIVDVAVAVLIRADGAVLLARRPAGKVYAGFWEFPGGKVETDEPTTDALRREIREELDVDIELAYPWITRVFTYPHARVRLHFHRVYSWRGDPRTLEHDALSWEMPSAVRVAPLLPANGPVLRGLSLPAEYAITYAAVMGVGPFLTQLEARLRRGLSLIQLREQTLAREEVRELGRRVIVLAREHGARVLVNSDTALAREIGADGVHLTSAQLRTLESRPEAALCGASCHSKGELLLAERLGADFAVLGPVRATPQHPESTPLDWQGFENSLSGCGMPVYALGGMLPGDLEQARRCGAHGVAMMRGAWA